MSERFSSKPASKDQQLAMKEIRSAFQTLEAEVECQCPSGRYKALAFTALEEAAMWANKAVTHEWSES